MGTWGPGALQNDAALDFVRDLEGTLVAAVEEFLDKPDLERRFARAFAALELMTLLVKHTPTATPVPAELERWKAIFLGTFDREIDRYSTDARFKKAQRKALAKLLESLAAKALELHRGDPGAPTSALSRLLARTASQQREGQFTLSYPDLMRWVTPYGEDVARAWAECVQGDWMVAIARALGVAVATLQPIVDEALRPLLARLPADAPSPTDAVALQRWAEAAVNAKKKELLPPAAIARAAAHLVQAGQPDADHLGLAVSELLGAAKLEACVAAEKTGMSWLKAFTSADGPGWAAHQARNAELAALMRSRLSASELKLR